MTYTPRIGSVSHGTLLTIDLLEAFADELNRIETERDDVQEAYAVITLHNAGWLNIADSEEAQELVNDLQDALNEFAPAYCYFGTNEGDGSDFGYWPLLDSVDELPRVSDPAEVEGMGEDCVFVNDHGNVTVYGADGSVLWDCV